MYLAMLKKDIKQFFREKMNLIVLLIFPILLITTLSVGLESMMDGGSIFKSDEKNIVYYSVDENNYYKEGFLEFSEAVEESVGIKFKEVKGIDEVQEKVDNYEALAYINLEKEEIGYYASEKGMKTEGKIFNEIFDSFLKEYGTYKTIGNFNKEGFTKLIKNKYSAYVEEEVIDKSKKLTAGEFYTFAELALIIAFLGLTIGELTFKEKKLRTVNRIVLSKTNHLTMMMSKISLGVIIGTLQTILVYVYTSLVLKIDWGENTFKFIFLFIVFALFTSVSGAVVGALVKTEGVVSGVLNIFSFIWGALGGCFTPLSMIISIPIVNKLVYLSPIYWISTSTSTMICGFDTIAYVIALIIPIKLSLLFLVVYLLKMRNKGGIVNA